MRKIIQIVPGQYTMTALCDDGTYWKLVGTNDHPDDRKWWELIMKLPDVPQDPDGAA
jgi:hypothetical protein